MSDLVGSLSKSMIRLSVVDPKLGLISDLTINAANQYASENPGSTFLFIDGDNNLRYLSIGEVNRLEPRDLIRKQQCNADPVPCGSPKVIVSGGGGLGAVGNAVISQDGNGSLLAVDVVAGGYGYTSNPRADLFDACDIGSGAVLKTELGNELAYEEFFDEIEEYIIEEQQDQPFTSEDYDLDGNPLGTFDAEDYFSVDPETGELDDPIQKEIEIYQKLVREIKNPWWTTRTVQPGSITAEKDSFPKAYAVNLPTDLRTRLEYNGSPVWTEFMDTFAISPVPPSNARGSDYAGRLFVLNYELEFPYDGEYIFRGSCDNSGKVYVDQEFVQDLGGFFDSPNVSKKRITKGFHRLRIDLLNQPIFEDLITQNRSLDDASYVDVIFNVYGQGNGAGNASSNQDNTARWTKIDDVFIPPNSSILYKRQTTGSSIQSTTVNSSIFSGGNGATFHRYNEGTWYKGVQIRNGGDWNDTNPENNYIEWDDETRLTLGKYYQQQGQRFGISVWKRKSGDSPNTSNIEKLFFNFVSEDGSHSFTLNGVKRSKTSKDVTIKLKPNVNYIVKGGSTRKDGKTEQGLIKKGTKDKEGGTGESNKIFADHILSANDNDDIQVTASSGIFRSSNKRSVTANDRTRNTYDLIYRIDAAPKNDIIASSSSSGPIQETIVFDTINYINKADRKLWRCNVYGRGGFINEYGICPFDTTQPTLPDNPYAGVHVIRWENIKFPIDGEYDITIGVDDNVTLYIGNNSTGGNVDNNTGLRSIESGGDEYIIRKQGFRAPSVANPVTTERIRIKAGTYRIRAELEQIPGGKFGFQDLKGINPMALAIQIKTSYSTTRVVSAKSWNENPMGAALIIEAPDPPIPQEIKPPQIGRCPNNPVWSTRDPGAKYQWYPVEIPDDKGGNPYLNRYTISPVKPLDTPGTDGSGKIWSNSWKVRIPFSGRYRLDGARADIARIKIDGEVKTGLTGVYTAEAQKWVEQNFAGWEDPKTSTVNVGRKSTFVDLSQGEHEIEIELINIPAGQPTIIDESIFDTIHWRQALIESSEYVDVEFTIFGHGAYKNLAVTFVSEDGVDSFTVLGSQTGNATRVDKVKVKKGIVYKVNAITTRQQLPSREYGIIEQGLIDGQGRKSLELGEGLSTSSMFADYIRSANDNDDVQVTASTGLFTSSNKRPADPFKAVDSDSTVWTKVDDIFDPPDTYHRYDKGTFYLGKRIRSGGDWNDTNPTTNYIQIDSTTRVTLGTYHPESGQRFGISVWKLKTKSSKYGRNTYDLTFKVEQDVNPNPVQSLPSSSSVRNGVTYSGPEIFGYSLSREGVTWRNFMNIHSVSPKTFDNIDQPDERIVGTFILSWANVNFPDTGQYDIKFAADNIAVLRIGGRKIAETTRFDIDDPAVIPVNVNQGFYTVEVELTNISNGVNIFRTNPSGVAIQITRRRIVYDRSASWAENPMGISASLVAPPCPKPGGGVGIVTNIYPIDPGNGYLPASPDGGYNVALVLTDIIPTSPGLGYTTGPIDVNGNLGIASVTAVGPNGEIQQIVVRPTPGFTSWPNIVAPDGFNAELTPVFEVVRDPLDIEPDRLIQVVDLVGLRQTGYIKGRAYYGAVFNKDGETYAGYYETAGELVKVYATLQESIDAEVTTEPSAIQRFGTETNSNNPQLNIPNTPSSGTEI